MRRFLVTSPLLLGGVATALGAQLPRIHPPRAPAWYQGVESRTLAFVRGPDTTRLTTTTPRITRLAWDPTRHGSAFTVTTTTLDVARATITDTLMADSLGAVVPPLATPAAGGDPWTRFLRFPLPPGPLDSGTTWGDTLAPGWPAPGTHSLFVQLTGDTLRRAVDTLGGQATILEVSGVARYRESGGSDPIGGAPYLVDAVGVMRETLWLDPVGGEMLARRRRLELDGIGVLHSTNGQDTLPVAISIDDAWGRIPEERAQVLTRPLPGSDSSLTLASTPTPLALHTIRHLGGVIESGFADNSGLVGTALAESDDGGRPRQYQALWTESGAADATALVSVRRDSLRLSGSRTGAWPVPRAPWAISDAGMEEQLLPALETLPDSATVTLRRFRPRDAEWDSIRVVARFLPDGARLFLLSGAGRNARSAIVVDRDGTLLTVQHAGEPHTRRLPPAGTARRARLDQVLALFGIAD